MAVNKGNLVVGHSYALPVHTPVIAFIPDDSHGRLFERINQLGDLVYVGEFSFPISDRVGFEFTQQRQEGEEGQKVRVVLTVNQLGFLTSLPQA